MLGYLLTHRVRFELLISPTTPHLWDQEGRIAGVGMKVPQDPKAIGRAIKFFKLDKFILYVKQIYILLSHSLWASTEG